MTIGFRAAAAILPLLLAACAGAPPKASPVSGGPQVQTEETIDVEAEGLANVIKGNLLATQESSLMAAQKAAVEKAVGVLVTGQMVVSQARLIEDQVFSKTAGYLKSWEILSREEEDGIYRTRIKASVKLGDVREDLDALGLLIRTKKVGNPRVMLLIEEKIDDRPSDSRTVETELARQLLDKGYKVVDMDQLAEIRNQQAIVRALRGDEAEAADLARRFGAEICLVGSAQASLFGSQDSGPAAGLLGDMVSYRGRLNFKAVKAASGQVVLADSREGAGMDLTKENAAVRCLSQLAAESGEMLADRLAPALFEGAELQLVVAGVGSFGRLQGLVDSVRAADGVRQVITRSFAPDESVLDVELGWGNAQTLAAQLAAKVRPGFEIIEVTAYNIRATLGGTQ